MTQKLNRNFYKQPGFFDIVLQKIYVIAAQCRQPNYAWGHFANVIIVEYIVNHKTSDIFFPSLCRAVCFIVFFGCHALFVRHALSRRGLSSLCSFTTMFSHSPFDEALSRPFMADEEPLKEKKPKFSWTSVASTVFSMDDDDDTYETYEAPLVVVPLADEESPPERRRMTTPMTTLHYQVSMDVSELTHDLEQAVLRERHSDIEDICMDMKTLHGIQQDFAEIVDSQDYDIKRMSWLAIEAFEETECGLEELETSHTMANMVGQRKEKLVKVTAAVGLTVLTIVWALSKYYDGGAIHGDSGDPQKFP